MNKKFVELMDFVQKAINECNCHIEYGFYPEYNQISVVVFKWDKIAEFNEFHAEGDYLEESSRLCENIKDNFGDFVKDVECHVPTRSELLGFGGFEHREVIISFEE